jgi:hypothetical protein
MGAVALSQAFTSTVDTCTNALVQPKGTCVVEVAFTAPANLGSHSTMGGTLSLDFTYGPNSGSLPTISLIGKVK